MSAGAPDRLYDVIIVGSGFGGAMAAQALVSAGRDVLVIERGDWVARGEHNRRLESVMELDAAYSTESPYDVVAGGDAPQIGALFCVGGPSVFYGAVSNRFRERDFDECVEVVKGSGARWPLDYAELEPYYEEAEHLLGVVGESGVDPTEPWRRQPLARSPEELSPIADRLRNSARGLGLTTFRLPLAVNYSASNGRNACVLCSTCDCYPCSVSAKNDLATAVLAPLVHDGRLELLTNRAATMLEVEGNRIVAVRCRRTGAAGSGNDADRPAGERYRGREVILAAGALATPHLLLASGLDRMNPAGAAIGRYLLRHSSALVYGYFTDLPDPTGRFHKELAIHDFYFGDPASGVMSRLGSLQQVHHPPQALVERRLPRALRAIPTPLMRRALTHAIGRATGLLAIAEDQPRFENRVWVDPSRRDALGLPRLMIQHRYTPRDEAARAVLARHARRVLREAGARFVHAHPIRTFSHAAGTVRMGDDPASAPLDRWCRFRGIENLRVQDASCMATVASVNPSLTIAALSLRASAAMRS